MFCNEHEPLALLVELTPKLAGQIDFKKYNNGVEIMENMTVFPQGGASRRYGTRYVAPVKDSSKVTRLIPFEFNTLNVVSAGERDPDADGAEGMSASKMRAAASQGDENAFAQGVPNSKLAKSMYDAVRKGMGVQDTVASERELSKGEEKEKEVVQAEQIKDDAAQRDQDILKIKYILK